MDDAPPLLSAPSVQAEAQAPAAAAEPTGLASYSRNVFVNGLSLAVAGGTGVVLPAYLTHHMSTAMYGAWLLILQVASYITLLDLGIQTAIAKYIAEHTAARQPRQCSEHASAGAAITLALGALGVFVSAGLALLVPVLFRDVPHAMQGDVSRGVFLVGSSMAVLLACSSFGALFRGVQRFKVPSFITVANKLAYLALLIALVARHSSLTAMGVAVAVLNLLTAASQIAAWRFALAHIQVRFGLVRWPVVRTMIGYCAVLGIWTSGMLIITGLDLTIVGHYDFAFTAFYGVAATPVSFLLLLLQATLTPLMPAVSAMSVSRSPEQMGAVLSRSTRLVFLLLQLGGLPLVLFGYWILLLWVGPAYARHSLAPMRILLLAQIVRNFMAPYATMVLAVGRQRAATLSGVLEAGTNLASSIVLGKYFGGVGVAAGTLIGAVVGVLTHLLVSMRGTEQNLRISPLRLLREAGLHPAVAALPTLALLPWFWKAQPPTGSWWLVLVWFAGTAPLAWWFGVSAQERPLLLARLGGLMHRLRPTSASTG